MWIEYLTPSFSYVTTHQFLWVIYNNTYCRISNMRDFQFRWCYTLPFPTGNRRRTERGLGSCRVEVGEKRENLYPFNVSFCNFPLIYQRSILARNLFSPCLGFERRSHGSKRTNMRPRKNPFISSIASFIASWVNKGLISVISGYQGSRYYLLTLDVVFIRLNVL